MAKQQSKNPRQLAYEKSTANNLQSAMDKLMKERSTYNKKYGSWPTDEELMAERKKAKKRGL